MLSVMARYDYVFLGGGTACGYAARGLRELDADGSLLIVSADSEPPYDRPPLSKGFLKNDAMEPSDAHSNEGEFYEENGIQLMLNTRAESIDLAGHAVVLSDGDRVEYGKLLYALGSEHSHLSFPGADGVARLRTAADAERIRSAAQSGAKFVVIGGGYIGCEVAASLAGRGVEVHLVEAEPKLMRFFPDEMSSAIERQLANMDVSVTKSASVESISGTDVRLSNGEAVTADMVVEGVGASPRVGMARAAGLEMGPSGVRANAGLQASDPAVWVAGDVAEYADTTLEREFRAEHHMHAKWSGMHAGKAMAGDASAFRAVPYFFSDIGPLSMILRGDPEASGESFLFGDPDAPRLTEVILREDGTLAKFTDLRTEWSEQEPLVDMAEKLVEKRVSLEGMRDEMRRNDFDARRLEGLLG